MIRVIVCGWSESAVERFVKPIGVKQEVKQWGGYGWGERWVNRVIGTGDRETSIRLMKKHRNWCWFHRHGEHKDLLFLEKMMVAEQRWQRMKSQRCQEVERWWGCGSYGDTKIGGCEDFVSKWQELVFDAFNRTVTLFHLFVRTCNLI